jgi:hypothetical protein
MMTTVSWSFGYLEPMVTEAQCRANTLVLPDPNVMTL